MSWNSFILMSRCNKILSAIHLHPHKPKHEYLPLPPKFVIHFMQLIFNVSKFATMTSKFCQNTNQLSQKR